MKEESLSTKSMLLDIGAMRSQALPLLEKEKPYSGLLRVILSRDFYYKDDVPVPTLKELCSETGLTYGKAKKLIEQIYFDLVLAEEGLRPVFSFKRQRFEFLLHGRGKKYLNFTTDSLPILPRVGENISIVFLKEQFP